MYNTALKYLLQKRPSIPKQSKKIMKNQPQTQPYEHSQVLKKGNKQIKVCIIIFPAAPQAGEGQREPRRQRPRHLRHRLLKRPLWKTPLPDVGAGGPVDFVSGGGISFSSPTLFSCSPQGLPLPPADRRRTRPPFCCAKPFSAVENTCLVFITCSFFLVLLFFF